MTVSLKNIKEIQSSLTLRVVLSKLVREQRRRRRGWALMRSGAACVSKSEKEAERMKQRWV